MADKTITALSAISSYDDNGVIPIDSGVQTYKITKAKVAQAMQKWAAGYDAVIGSAAYCTHANIAAALADSALGTYSRVLITESQTLAATLAANKAGWQFFGLPGVTLTAGVATVGFTVTAAHCWFSGIRFVGFTTGILLSTGANYARILNCNFNTTTTDVNDTAVAGANGPFIGGTIDE